MNCAQIRDRLLAWRYNELPGAEQTAVEVHLRGCAGCREQSIAWDELRGKLDAFRAPAVDVDVGRLYQEAFHRQERRLRRWRRMAVAVSAAAAMVLIALGLRLEIQVGASQVVFRWGSAPKSALGTSAASSAPHGVASPIDPEEFQLVKDLIRVLAQDVQSRDREHREQLLRLQARIEAFLDTAYDRSTSMERDVAALYAAQFRLPQKGDKR
jgi:hypothetical protein